MLQRHLHIAKLKLCVSSLRSPAGATPSQFVAATLMRHPTSAVGAHLSLWVASSAAATGVPTKGTSAASRAACSCPPSPQAPCTTGHTTSALDLTASARACTHPAATHACAKLVDKS